VGLEVRREREEVGGDYRRGVLERWPLRSQMASFVSLPRQKVVLAEGRLP
jgi:hypothetical protein